MLLLSVLLVIYYQQQQKHKYLNVVVVGVVGRILPTTTTSVVYAVTFRPSYYAGVAHSATGRWPTSMTVRWSANVLFSMALHVL